MTHEFLLENLLNCFADYHYSLALNLLKDENQGDFVIQHLSDKTFVNAGDPADTICILLEGICKVIVSNSIGNVMTVDVMGAPQIFGLSELVLEQKRYSASVIASGNCKLLFIPCQHFLELLHGNQACYVHIARYFAYLAVRNMDSVEEKALLSKKDQFISYLFNRCKDQPLPYTLEESRTDTASVLHLNLRTLFRYLSELQSEEMLTIVHGKIIITEANTKKLRTRLNSLI